MVKKNNILSTQWQDQLLVFIFCATIYSFLLFNVHTDIELHIKQIAKINRHEAYYPPNFLFYFLVNAFSGFSNLLASMNIAAITILSVATTWKYSLTKKIIRDIVPVSIENSGLKLLPLLSFSLLLSFAIPDYYNAFVLNQMYLGRIVSVVWHNSTTILVFPFALLLFWKQFVIFRNDEAPTTRQLLYLNLLVVLNILIKPSFIFIFIPVSAIMVWHKWGFKSLRTTIINLSPAFVGLTTILIQYILIYHLQSGSFQKESSAVIITYPFELFRQWIPSWYIPISLFMSFLLPVATMAFYKNILQYRPFVFALYLTIAGMLISAFLLETGPRMTHGNFIWQNVICAYLLLLTNVTFLFQKFHSNERRSKKFNILMVLFLLQILSGIVYLVKIFVTKSYL